MSEFKEPQEKPVGLMLDEIVGGIIAIAIKTAVVVFTLRYLGAIP